MCHTGVVKRGEGGSNLMLKLGVFCVLTAFVACDSVSFVFNPPLYNQTTWEAFQAKILLNPPALIPNDPYEAGINTTRPLAVCGVRYMDAHRVNYTLKTYPGPPEAYADGAYVTHNGTCGACSTLQDLGAYMQHHNLTAPVRTCGLDHPFSEDENIKCLLALGFTMPCAQIWYYNTKNSRKDCLVPCLEDLNKPYNGPPPERALNSCLQCDEDKSGPVFKKVAARTRRDSGLSSAIYRPPSEVYPVYHFYY